MSTEKNKIVEPDMVACSQCLKEVPQSEAMVPEASEYVAHFCGIECYNLWLEKQKEEQE
ncbi:MAG: DUF3330 domain-containing protein [Gammaproteobacteria bacterium]|nr:DUF3330 domain-containing protein [Gammaproteobacteria bacterium]